VADREPEALTLDAHDDQAETGPGVEPVVQQPQLRRARRELEEAEGSSGTTAGGVQFHQPSRAICRRISNARRSTGFTAGHASWPHVVDVMERIKSSRRTQGSRKGCVIQSLGAPPYVDSHMGRPRHVPFGLWKSRASYPRAQALAAVEGCRMGHDLPLEVVVGEPIAYLNLHRQHESRDGVRALRRSRLGLLRR
jgi:hypothetical protein